MLSPPNKEIEQYLQLLELIKLSPAQMAQRGFTPEQLNDQKRTITQQIINNISPENCFGKLNEEFIGRIIEYYTGDELFLLSLLSYNEHNRLVQNQLSYFLFGQLRTAINVIKSDDLSERQIEKILDDTKAQIMYLFHDYNSRSKTKLRNKIKTLERNEELKKNVIEAWKESVAS